MAPRPRSACTCPGQQPSWVGLTWAGIFLESKGCCADLQGHLLHPTQ